MAITRKMQLAYGHASLGTLVLGGESNDGFPLYDAKFTGDSYQSVAITAEFGVIGTSDSDFAARIDALNNLRHNSGDLGWTGDTQYTFSNLSGSVSSGTLTITDAAGGGQFVDDHIGLPIDVDGVGSFQITARSSANVVTCKLPPELAAPSTFSAKAGRIGYEIARVHHASVQGGYFARTTLREIPHEMNSRLKRRYMLTVAAERPATDATNDPSGRRKASFAVAEASSTLRTAVFEGEYTPTTASDTTNTTARTNYQAAVNTWVATVLLSLGGSWKKLDQSFSEPDENGTLRFAIRRAEAHFPDTASSTVDDDTIRNASVSFERLSTVDHGLPLIKPSTVRISYTAWAPKTTGWEALRALWVSTIKPHLITSVETEFGSGAVEISESFAPAVSSNQINGSVTLFVRSTGSTLIEFNKFVSYSIDTNERTEEKYSGQQHDYVGFSATPVIRAQVFVSTMRVGAPVNDGVDVMAGPQAPAGDVVNATISDGWQVPGPPPFPSALVAGNNPKWNPRPGVVFHNPRFWGYDPDGVSAKIQVTTSVYSLNWLWGNIQKQGQLGGGSSSDGGDGQRLPPAPGPDGGASTAAGGAAGGAALPDFTEPLRGLSFGL